MYINYNQTKIVVFSPNKTVLMVTKNSILYSSVQRMDFQKASGLSKCSLAKLKWAVFFFLESRGFLLATLPWMSCLFNFHVECPPFVNDLSYSRWMELESFGDGLIAFPRLMGCQYLLPDVLGYLLSSRHCWSVWVHLGTTVVWLVSSLLICVAQPFS